MKTKQNIGGVSSTPIAIERHTGNLLGAPNYPQQRVNLWTEHKRAKAMAHMALRQGDIAAAMGSMVAMHRIRVAIDQTRLDEYMARSEASVRMMLEASVVPAKAA